jgi:PD-(D/E)XK endonuclease
MTISWASFSSARPAIRRACSSEVRGSLILCASVQSVARVVGVSNGRGPADAIARLSCVTTDQKGAVAELAIQLAAIKLGIEVYRPIAEGGRYDMIFDLEDRLLRVQCKWATRRGEVVVVMCQSARRSADGFIRRPYTAAQIDAIAAYNLELDRCFLIPIARVQGRPSIAFRLSPCLNNQKRRINWADDFDLAATLSRQPGAVAQLGERCHGMAEVRGSIPLGSIV